jgi:hypothetical protein
MKDGLRGKKPLALTCAELQALKNGGFDNIVTSPAPSRTRSR